MDLRIICENLYRRPRNFYTPLLFLFCFVLIAQQQQIKGAGKHSLQVRVAWSSFAHVSAAQGLTVSFRFVYQWRCQISLVIPVSCWWLAWQPVLVLHTAGRVKQAKQALQCLGLVHTPASESLFCQISIERTVIIAPQIIGRWSLFKFTYFLFIDIYVYAHACIRRHWNTLWK